MQFALQHWRTKMKREKSVEEKFREKPLVLRKRREHLKSSSNWPLFYYKFNRDHALPNLIWNYKVSFCNTHQVIKTFSSQRLCSLWSAQDFLLKFFFLPDERGASSGARVGNESFQWGQRREGCARDCLEPRRIRGSHWLVVPLKRLLSFLHKIGFVHVINFFFYNSASNQIVKYSAKGTGLTGFSPAHFQGGFGILLRSSFISFNPSRFLYFLFKLFGCSFGR